MAFLFAHSCDDHGHAVLALIAAEPGTLITEREGSLHESLVEKPTVES